MVVDQDKRDEARSERFGIQSKDTECAPEPVNKTRSNRIVSLPYVGNSIGALSLLGRFNAQTQPRIFAATECQAKD